VSNLDFQDKADIATWRERAAEHRAIAEKWPAYDKRMVTVTDYRFELGPWHVTFILEIWKEPVWVGSVSIQEQIGFETIKIQHGHKIEIPKEALLAISSWSPEHFEQARFILGEVFGPILRPGDDHQPALEFKGLMTLQWRVPYEGEKPWRKNQN
jgi:hypothetical protein